MKKKLSVLFLGLSLLISSTNVFAGEGAYEPKNVKFSVNEDVFTSKEIEAMSSEQLEELHLLPLDFGKERLNSSYLVLDIIVNR